MTDQTKGQLTHKPCTLTSELPSCDLRARTSQNWMGKQHRSRFWEVLMLARGMYPRRLRWPGGCTTWTQPICWLSLPAGKQLQQPAKTLERPQSAAKSAGQHEGSHGHSDTLHMLNHSRVTGSCTHLCASLEFSTHPTNSTRLSVHKTPYAALPVLQRIDTTPQARDNALRTQHSERAQTGSQIQGVLSGAGQ